MGRESNLYNELKLVLADPRLCECTRVIMGGVSLWTPKRSLTPMYGDNLLVIMKNLRRPCEGKGKIEKCVDLFYNNCIEYDKAIHRFHQSTPTKYLKPLLVLCSSWCVDLFPF